MAPGGAALSAPAASGAMPQEARGQGQERRGVCPKAVVFPSAWGMPREWPDPSRPGRRTSRNEQNGLGVFLSSQACIPQPQGRARRSLRALGAPTPRPGGGCPTCPPASLLGCPGPRHRSSPALTSTLAMFLCALWSIAVLPVTQTLRLAALPCPAERRGCSAQAGRPRRRDLRGGLSTRWGTVGRAEF